MTDTTDIKALREAALKATPGPWVTVDYFWIAREKDGHGGEFIVFDNGPDAAYVRNLSPDRILALLDQLEAERQRADDAESKLRSEKLVHLVTKDAMRKAHRRVVELEGDQVPVSAEFFADGKWWPFSNAEHKANTLAAGYPVRELFTAAPKPVVVLSDCTFEAVSHMAHWYTEGECAAFVSGVEYAKKHMLAAGIVVKDGE